jgi:hypothetical protein
VDQVGNSVSATAISFSRDVTAPTISIATGTVSHALLTGSALAYRGDLTGNFTFAATVTDGGSGAKSATFPAISTTGWTHNVETVTSGSTPFTSPSTLTSASFSWTASPTNPGNYTISAVDAVGNSVNATAITFASDTTGPTASDVACTNTGVVRKYELNEVVTLTFSEAVDPASIASGWTGSARTVTVKITDQAGSDPVTFFDGAGTGTPLPLGTIDHGRGDYTGANRTFDSSSMSLSGATLSITLTAPSGNVTQAGGTGTVVWTPSATVTDLLGNAMSTSPLSKTTFAMC